LITSDGDDRPFCFEAGGAPLFHGSISRNLAVIEQSLREGEDPISAGTALLPISS
jgi:hypothetical protein